MDKKFIQGTPEWLEMRRNMVMASDSPVIMGVSPWKTPAQLYIEKMMGGNTPVSPAMERGKKLEEEARMIFEKLTGHFVEPTVMIHTSEEWLGASADGWNKSGILVEIKCPGKEDHDLALDGKVPKKYVPQLQHLMYVFGVDTMYYFSYRPEDEYPTALLEIPVSVPFLIDWKEKVEKFYKCMRTATPPQDLDDISLHVKPQNHEAFEIMEERLAYLMTEIKMLESEAAELRDKLIKECDGHAVKGSLLKFTPIVSKGNVDYSAIPQLKGVDLDFYRKADRVSWRIDLRK